MTQDLQKVSTYSRSYSYPDILLYINQNLIELRNSVMFYIISFSLIKEKTVKFFFNLSGNCIYLIIFLSELMLVNMYWVLHLGDASDEKRRKAHSGVK